VIGWWWRNSTEEDDLWWHGQLVAGSGGGVVDDHWSRAELLEAVSWPEVYWRRLSMARAHRGRRPAARWLVEAL
jgi:hypothetical protein